MTRQLDIEQLLEAWLDEGPTDTADAVFDAAVARVYRQRQRAGWRLPWRDTPMNGYFKLAAGLAAVVVTAVVGWQLLPGSSGFGGPSAAPTPSAQPAVASGAPSPSSPFPPGYPIARLLTPGSHTTELFKPAVTFTVPEGWIKTGDEAPTSEALGIFGLIQDTPANRTQWALTGEAAGGILVVAGLTSPSFICEAWEDNRGATAAEMVAKVLANPKLRTTVVEDVAIGGLTGKQFDYRFNIDFKNETCPGDPNATKLTAYTNRSILLDVPGGGVLVMFIGAQNTADYEAQLAQAMLVVQSFEFDVKQ